MADEEAVLKKKLEDTTDFEERRAIRQQLRDLRKKKLDALESGTTAIDRPRRRERVKREEQTTVITETKTDDDTSHPATQTKIEVNYSCTVTTDGPAENGVKDEPKERKSSVENENSVEDKTPVDDQQGENGTQFSVQINGEKSPQDSNPKQVDSTPQEQSMDSEKVTESSSTAEAEAVTAEGESNEDQTEEVELTAEVVETIEDVDMLERLLKEVPLNEYALRKAIRLQIRQLRVKKEASKENAYLLGLEKMKQSKHKIDLPENKPCESLNVALETTENDDSIIKTETVFTVSQETAAGDAMMTSTGAENSEKGESDCDVDDASSTQSSITSEGSFEPENPGKPPPRPPRPSKTPSVTSEAELTGDFKKRILGKPAGPPPRDLSKKGKPSAPEQVDFRGQLKKTGLRADKDLTAQGKRKQQLSNGDFRGQLKTTGVNTSGNLSALKSVGKKKEGPVQVDFRGNLKGTPDDGATTKKAPPRPPPTYLTKVTDGGASQSLSKSTGKIKQVPAPKEQGKSGESSEKEIRKISSADLFNMLHKPVETSKEGYLVQRGIKKAEASKSAPQKLGTPSVDTSLEDDKFKARMAWRKERSDKQFLPPKGANADRKMSAGVETKDFQAVLKKAGVQHAKPSEKSMDQLTEEEPSSDSSRRSERFSVDIQDKGELQKLRADLLREKESKDKDGVSTTTEKVTEVEQVDGGQMTKEVRKTTEVHKGPGGATMTVTKTTSKTEVRQTGPGKGTSIEAMLAQKRKEKMMTKKQQQADTRNKRMAFKEKLEAQSPKVAGGGRTFQSGNAAINSLQEWCRRRTKYHEGVDIQNFTTSWANGLAMCALLNYFLPEKIPFDTLDPKDKRGNWTLAFKVANEEGIEPLLELEDVMAVDIPEPKSLITYVHFIYQHFAEKQQQQKEG